jgi:hypothetical protein
MNAALPPGIWYEEGRGRFRVRVYKGTTVIHLSYHEDYDEALSAWHDAHRTKHVVREAALLHDRHAQLSHLLGALQYEERDPLAGLITLDEFSATYFVSPPSKHSVWRWVRYGHIPAVRIGRRYYITPDDAAAFVKKGTDEI